MGVEAFDPAGFSGKVPLFPLPNCVLLPYGILPLHIFEPRYRAMTEAALEGERLIAMSLLKPGWESEYHGNPPVHEVIGMGRIIQESRLEDGRFNLVLCGVARVRIRQEFQQSPFRAARVELLSDRDPSGKGYERKRRVLLAFYRQVLSQLLKEANAEPPDDLPLGPLCDLLTSVIALDLPVKQSFLEETDVGARCDRLMELLQKSKASGVGEAGKGPWPPSPSMN